MQSSRGFVIVFALLAIAFLSFLLASVTGLDGVRYRVKLNNDLKRQTEDCVSLGFEIGRYHLQEWLGSNQRATSIEDGKCIGPVGVWDRDAFWGNLVVQSDEKNDCYWLLDEEKKRVVSVSSECPLGDGYIQTPLCSIQKNNTKMYYSYWVEDISLSDDGESILGDIDNSTVTSYATMADCSTESSLKKNLRHTYQDNFSVFEEKNDGLIKSFLDLHECVVNNKIQVKPFFFEKDSLSKAYGTLYGRQHHYAMESLGVGPVITHFEYAIHISSDTNMIIFKYNGGLTLWNPYMYPLEETIYWLELCLADVLKVSIDFLSEQKGLHAKHVGYHCEQILSGMGQYDSAYPHTMIKIPIKVALGPGEEKMIKLNEYISLDEVTGNPFLLAEYDYSFLKNQKISTSSNEKKSTHMRRQPRQGFFMVDPSRIKLNVYMPEMIVRLCMDPSKNIVSNIFHEVMLPHQPSQESFLEIEKDTIFFDSTYQLVRIDKNNTFFNNLRGFVNQQSYADTKDNLWQWQKVQKPVMHYPKKQYCVGRNLDEITSVGYLSHAMLAAHIHDTDYCLGSVSSLWNAMYDKYYFLPLDVKKLPKLYTILGEDILQLDNTISSENLLIRQPLNIHSKSINLWASLLNRYTVYTRAQSLELAKYIIEEMSFFKPFTTLESWVNSGVLQKAIDRLGTDLRMPQALLLEALAPILVCRGDTFWVHVYGEVIDNKGIKCGLYRAYCVQRLFKNGVMQMELIGCY